jgi:hypothetical protein
MELMGGTLKYLSGVDPTKQRVMPFKSNWGCGTSDGVRSARISEQTRVRCATGRSVLMITDDEQRNFRVSFSDLGDSQSGEDRKDYETCEDNWDETAVGNEDWTEAMVTKVKGLQANGAGQACRGWHPGTPGISGGRASSRLSASRQ